MFRALYKLERNKKRICGWVRDSQQMEHSPNSSIQGTYFSGVLREESQIPLNDRWVIDDNNFLTSLDTVEPIAQKNSRSDVQLIENNIAKLKEDFRDGILKYVPLESQLTGLISGGEKFVSQQKWIKDKLILLKKGIEEIRSAGSFDAFMIRVKYARLLEESAPPEQVSVLDSVNSETGKVPLIYSMKVNDESTIDIGYGNVANLVLRKTNNTVDKSTVSNEIHHSCLIEPEINYCSEDNSIIYSNKKLPSSFNTGKIAGTLLLSFEKETFVEGLTLKCGEGSSSIYISVNNQNKKYMKLNSTYTINAFCKTIQISIPKRIQHIGPLSLYTLKPHIEESYVKTIQIPDNCIVSITRDENISFCILKDGTRYLPSEYQGETALIPIKQPEKLSKAVYGSTYDNNLIFPIKQECQLEFLFNDDNRRSVDVTIEKLGQRFIYQTIQNWEQIDSSIFLKEKITGELLVTKI